MSRCWIDVNATLCNVMTLIDVNVTSYKRHVSGGIHMKQINEFPNSHRSELICTVCKLRVVSAHMSHIRIRNKCVIYVYSCTHT